MKSLVIFILISAACISYLYVFAENRYVSVSQFAVVIEESSGSDVTGGISALLGNGSTGGSDTQAVIGFIQSADLLIKLEKQFDLPTHYTAPEKDFLFRLWRDHSLEDRLKYYRKKITARFNQTTGLVDLTVETFSPELALEVTKFILKETEDFINKQNQTIANERLAFVRSELDRAQKLIQQREKEILDFQNKHKIIQPEAIIQAQMEAIQRLRLETIDKEIERTTLSASSPNSPLLKALSTTIYELKQEISRQEEALSGSEQEKLNQILIEFKELTLNLEFANKLKTGTEVLLEQTRADAAANSRFFSVIQNPYLPEEHAHPRRIYLSITASILIFLVIYIVLALFRSITDRTK